MRAGYQLAESGDGKVYIVVFARTREESVDCGWREANGNEGARCHKVWEKNENSGGQGMVSTSRVPLHNS